MSLQERIQARIATARRTTPAFFLLRGGVWLAATGALLTACPHQVATSLWAPALVVAGALPAALPRTVAVTLLLLGAVTGWIAATTVYGEQVGYVRLVVLAALLYTTHILAAVSAVIPHDSIVAPSALVGWLPRTALLVVVTAVVGVAGALLADAFGGTRYLVASLVGLALAAALAYYLARLVNR